MTACRFDCRRRGLTLVEVTISIVIVSVMLVAALTAAGSSNSRRYRTDLATNALILAEDLMAEITALPYSDPDTETNGARQRHQRGRDGSQRLRRRR